MAASKRPRDPNQLAKMVVDIATGDNRSENQEQAVKVPQRKKAKSVGRAEDKA